MQANELTALIFGVSGQDGAYLADLLLRRGLEVHGTSRDKDSSSFSNLRALGILEKVQLHSTLLGDLRSVVTTLRKVQPRYIYNLTGPSSVGLSFDQPVENIDSIIRGTINVMEAMRFLAMAGLTTPLQGSVSATRRQAGGRNNRVPASQSLRNRKGGVLLGHFLPNVG